MYIELHSASAFSFLEGASLPEELAAQGAAWEMPAMALLDADGVYGAPRFHMAAKKAGIKAHIGAEITVKDFFSSQQKANSNSHPEKTFRLPLLVESRAGYQNLCRLVTRMKMRCVKHARPGECAITLPELGEFSGGLVCLTGGDEGVLARALEANAAAAEGSRAQAHNAIQQLTAVFGGDNVYLELQRHFDRGEEARNQVAADLATACRLPLLATNGVRHATRQQREILDVFTCIRTHTRLETAGRLLAKNSERHLKSPAEMAELFADLPQAIVNTRELSHRLEFTLNDLGYEFPRYPVPEGESMQSFLRQRTEEGFRRRYGGGHPCRERARRQIERELALIEKLKLAGYFLIVWDIVRFCREQNILVQGRGSAANSAVCYSLGFTAVDPVGMDLLFERFLSEERGEWPDIDLDLPSGEQRERAIQYVYARYGERGAAMTANVITYRGRSAAREVGKALGFDPETLERLSRMVGSWEYKDPSDTLDRQFRDAGCDLRHPRIRKFFELCLSVQDLPRHLGQHSGGMVICQGQLDSVVPLEPASMPGRVVVQWDKEDCSDLGLIKVDLLGLGMMAVLEDSIAMIGRDYGQQVDLAHLPQDDPEVYAALQKADTVGMFQIESRAQMSCLPRLRPTRFYDIVIQVAIIRPGPIVGQMVNPFLKRRQGRERVTYAHPGLEPVLERTLGVPLFQEQLLRVAMIVANFTGGEAEELRRAVGSKRSQARMKEIEARLRRGMTENGLAPATQEEIIRSITSFALYGFPESHAASFALLAYASAYLKCRYLAAFTAALLNNQPMGFYHSSTIVKDAQRHGLKVRPVDVTCSQWLCTLEEGLDFEHLKLEDEISRRGVENRTSARAELETRKQNFALRLGLRYVRGLRQEAAEALVKARAGREFASVEDLAHRVPTLRKGDLRMLAEIGALNNINHSVSGAVQRPHRRDALWDVEKAARPAGPLLTGAGGAEGSSPLERMNEEERLVADFRGTGLTVGPHPMAYRRPAMNAINVRTAAELHALPHGKRLRIAGSVICRQRPATAHGFVFLSLEDETGIANAIITPDMFDRHRRLLVAEKFLLVEGKLQNLDGVISVKAEHLEPLEISAAETRSHDFH